MTLTPEMEVAVKYGSHLPALLACIAVTDGAVLELGVGHFSTPHLHALCGAMGRILVSVELDEGWRNEFKKYNRESPSHLPVARFGRAHTQMRILLFIAFALAIAGMVSVVFVVAWLLKKSAPKEHMNECEGPETLVTPKRYVATPDEEERMRE